MYFRLHCHFSFAFLLFFIHTKGQDFVYYFFWKNKSSFFSLYLLSIDTFFSPPHTIFENCAWGNFWFFLKSGEKSEQGTGIRSLSITGLLLLYVHTKAFKRELMNWWFVGKWAATDIFEAVKLDRSFRKRLCCFDDVGCHFWILFGSFKFILLKRFTSIYTSRGSPKVLMIYWCTPTLFIWLLSQKVHSKLWFSKILNIMLTHKLLYSHELHYTEQAIKKMCLGISCLFLVLKSPSPSNSMANCKHISCLFISVQLSGLQTNSSKIYKRLKSVLNEKKKNQ